MNAKLKKEPQQVETEVALTLHDFCTRLSTTETRVELISGFESEERRKNRLKDTHSAFDGRFKAFINRPA